MGDNSQKLPLARSLNQIAETAARAAISQLGRALPCSVVAVMGSIVTVKFEVTSVQSLPQVTVPMFGPEYIRYPTQVGDKGVVLPIDVYLGGISGLGGGVATMAIPGNLSSLIFFPVASTQWSPTDDPDAVVVYGPTGVILRDQGSVCTLTLRPSGVTIDGSLWVTGNVSVGTGATGSFTTPTGQVVTVQDGIVTNIF